MEVEQNDRAPSYSLKEELEDVKPDLYSLLKETQDAPSTSPPLSAPSTSPPLSDPSTPLLDRFSMLAPGAREPFQIQLPPNLQLPHNFQLPPNFPFIPYFYGGAHNSYIPMPPGTAPPDTAPPSYRPITPPDHPDSWSPTPSTLASKSNPGKMKRVRTDFTPTHLALLEKSFTSSKYMRGQERDDLARKLNVPAKSVTIWFQNRRARMRAESRQAKFIKHAAESGSAAVGRLPDYR